MPLMLERWNDDKMDGLAAKVDGIGEQLREQRRETREDMRELRQETKELRQEAKDLRQEMKELRQEMTAGFERMNRLMTQGAIGLFSTMVLGFVGVLAAPL